MTDYKFEDDPLFAKWQEVLTADTFDDSDVTLSALSDAYYAFPPNLSTNPTLNERMFSEMFCPGINTFSDQSLNLQFALPCWERSGHVRDLIGGEISTGTTPDWDLDEKLSHIIDGNGVEIEYHGFDLSYEWTITFWMRQRESGNDHTVFNLEKTGVGIPLRLSYVASTDRHLLQSLGSGGSAADDKFIGIKDTFYFVVIRARKSGGNTQISGSINGANFSLTQTGQIYEPDLVKIGDATYDGDLKDIRIYNSHLTDGQLVRIQSNPDELYRWEIPLSLSLYSPVTIYTEIASGGAVCSGTAPVEFIDSIHEIASGGAVLGGSATLTMVQNEIATGGAVLGSATYSNGFNHRLKIIVAASNVSDDLYGYHMALVVTIPETLATLGEFALESNGVTLTSHTHSYVDDVLHLFAKTDLSSTIDNEFFLYFR